MDGVTGWYICGGEEEIAEQSIQVMHKYDWLEHIVLLHTYPEPPKDFGAISAKYNKVKEYHKNFGSRGSDPRAKYDLSVVPATEDGGWRETECRNYCLDIARKFNSKWLLQIDCDEYFQDLSKYLKSDYDGVFFQFNTFVFSDTTKTYSNQVNGIENPHMRLWKNKLDLQFIDANAKDHKNKQIHCWPQIPEHNLLSPYRLEHIHFHHMIASKRDSNYDNFPLNRLRLHKTFKWPKTLETFFKKENTFKSLNENLAHRILQL